MSTSSDTAAETPVPVVSARDLKKVYRFYESPRARLKELFTGKPCHREHTALEGVSFDLMPGEAIGLLGSNGSGKSTLLRLVAGSSEPSSGTCKVTGRVSTLLDLGSGLNPDLTGHENLNHAAMLLGLAPDHFEELKFQILDFAGLGEAMHDPVRTYSTGMTMRLGFSLAVHVPFDLMLIDEVLLVGDELFQRRSLRRIRELLQMGKSIILASHSFGDLTAVCDRLLLLENGKQSSLGDTDKLIQSYLEDAEREARRITEGDRLLHDTQMPQENLGKIELLGVEFLNPDGKTAEFFGSGEPLQVRIHYDAKEPVERPIFRIQYFRNDGLWIMGSNTSRGGLDIDRLEGSGTIVIDYDSVNLLDGDYYVSVGIWPDEYPSYLANSPFDLHDRRYVLRVRSGRPEGGGTVFCPHHWSRE